MSVYFKSKRYIIVKKTCGSLNYIVVDYKQCLPTTRTFKSRLSQSLSSLFPSVFALYIHTSTKFTTLDHIQVCFPHIFNPTHSPHILEQSQSALSTAQTPHILSDSTSLLVPQVIFDF